MAGSRSEMNKLVRKLRGAPYHCSVELTGSRHWRVVSPDGRRITMSQTPSDAHAYRNIRSDLKKYLGIVL